MIRPYISISNLNWKGNLLLEYRAFSRSQSVLNSWGWRQLLQVLKPKWFVLYNTREAKMYYKSKILYLWLGAIIITARIRSLREGNVFRQCLSVSLSKSSGVPCDLSHDALGTSSALWDRSYGTPQKDPGRTTPERPQKNLGRPPLEGLQKDHPRRTPPEVVSI